MPVLYIIIGPSGAGKSTYGQRLIPEYISIFNIDKEMLILEAAKYSDREVFEKADHLFVETRNAAIRERRDFAFETPFASLWGPDNIKLFRKYEYEIHGVFIGHESLNKLVNRIDDRIARGGNVVTPNNAEFNYYNSYLRVANGMMDQIFDRIDFYDTTDNDCYKIAEYRRPKLTEIRKTNWLREYVYEELKGQMPVRLIK